MLQTGISDSSYYWECYINLCVYRLHIYFDLILSIEKITILFESFDNIIFIENTLKEYHLMTRNKKDSRVLAM